MDGGAYRLRGGGALVRVLLAVVLCSGAGRALAAQEPDAPPTALPTADVADGDAAPQPNPAPGVPVPAETPEATGPEPGAPASSTGPEGAEAWAEDDSNTREGRLSRPTPPAPPPPSVEPPAVWDVARLLLVTGGVGVGGALAGLVAAGVGAAAVATGAAVLVRGWRLSPAVSAAGIFTFLFVPPLLLAAGAVAGWVGGRVAAPWLASLLVGNGVAGWRVRWGTLFMALDVAAHLLAGLFLLVTLGTTAVVCGALAAVNQSINGTWGAAAAPRGSQLGIMTGLLFSAALAVVVVPPVLVLLAGGVPLAALALGALTFPQGAP